MFKQINQKGFLQIYYKSLSKIIQIFMISFFDIILCNTVIKRYKKSIKI